ncbi:hypothetical protein Pen01_63250 [Phytomonospora endophytica]|nr:hypothetical protein Pen01_63250 [Phytomonospora endophytica]
MASLLVLALSAVLLATGAAGTAQATVSASIPFTYDGKDVRVKIYSRDVGDTTNSPVFKYGDLLNRAIRYKDANPSTEVTVRFAMYTMAHDVYIGFNPDDPASYGRVEDNDFGGTNSEKLSYSLVKAAMHKVKVDFVYQKDAPDEMPPKSGNKTNTVLNYVTGLLDDPCTGDANCQVGDYLRIRKVTWGDASEKQMHAKYMTVSHYLGDSGAAVLGTTYTTTTNVDQHNSVGVPDGPIEPDVVGNSDDHNWVQSGTLVNGHPELMRAYDGYFGKIYDNATNQAAFHTAVRAAHAAGRLNYDDKHFSAYFFPIPETTDAWNTTFNPIAKYVDQMAKVSGDRYLKVNMYHLKTDDFGERLYQELKKIYDSPDTALKHFRFIVKTNTGNEELSLQSTYGEIGKLKYYEADHGVKKTHTKNTMFAFSGPHEYYSITGSTNLKYDENTSKANSSLVIKEFTTDHPVYNEYKKIYEYISLD